MIIFGDAMTELAMILAGILVWVYVLGFMMFINRATDAMGEVLGTLLSVIWPITLTTLLLLEMAHHLVLNVVFTQFKLLNGEVIPITKSALERFDGDPLGDLRLYSLLNH